MATTTSLGSANYDPTSTAASLAQAYTADRQASITAQTTAASKTANALTALGSAMSAFQTTLSSLASFNKAVQSQAATFSSNVGTASATTSAQAGTYSFYVEQLATAGQVAYNGLSDTAAAGSGNLNVVLADGSNFTVDLANADNNHDGLLSAKEIAAAVNVAAGNNATVTASTLSINGKDTLVLTSANTGANQSVSLDTSAVTNAALKTALDDPANKSQLVTAQDAIVWVGAQGTGTKLQQASNTYTNIAGVSMTFSHAQAVGETPVTLTVATDTSATVANMQSFVDAYNKLNAVIAAQLAVGDATKGAAAGPMASDPGLIALRNRLLVDMRQSVGGASLTTFGIAAQRDGTLALDSGRLKKAIAANPTALNTIFGTASIAAPTGVLGDMNKVLGQWTSGVNGQISQRNTNNNKLQASLVTRQATLDDQYNSAYKRYLKQFTALQTLQSQMANNSNLFTALFNNNNSN